MNLRDSAGIPHDATSSPWPVFVSAAMKSVVANARDVAETDTTVLLVGESGTGKDLLARFIHDQSLRARGPFVVVACAGYGVGPLERGLFETGSADLGSRTRVEDADGGTLVLDEVGELPLSAQSKLLRLLQAQKAPAMLRGEHLNSYLDVRVIATTSQDLRLAVAAGRFRADLYYRLCVFPITLPALRERRADVDVLADRFITTCARQLARPAPSLSPAARIALARHDYTGNVRELRNVIERAVIRCRRPVIDAADLMFDPPLSPLAEKTEETLPAVAPESSWALPIELAQLERLAVSEALRRVGGNRTHAARLLGISLRTLRNKLKAWREGGMPLPAAEDPRCHDSDAAVARSSQTKAAEQAA